VRRLRTYSYKQRSILILLPLMLLAISTWSLNEQITPQLTPAFREVLLLSARIFFPGLFAIAVAFMLPTFDRTLQIVSVCLAYVFAVMVLPSYSPNVLMNPIICVLAAVSTLLAMLPYPVRFEENFINQTSHVMWALSLVALLPICTIIAMILVLRQMDTFILYTFDELFGQSFLSVIYVPLYLLLQALGFHELVGDLLTLRYQNNVVTAFVNSIVVINLFALPATLFTRSLFTKGYVRLFLTMLMAISILTNSIGSCLSLSLLLLLIFYPGSFALLLLSSMICYTLSYFLQVQPMTVVSNLYRPDIRLSEVTFSYSNSVITVLECFAIFIPVILVLLSMWIRRERTLDRRRKWRSINTGYTVNASSSLELRLLALLRALGGISNIVDVAEDGNWLYVQVASHDEVSLTSLNSLLPEKPLIDRINKLYLCEIGDESHFMHQRLSKLIANPFGESEYEVQLSTPFEIHPMEYDKANPTELALFKRQQHANAVS